VTDTPDLSYEALPGVRDAIERIGRAEDVRFSPDNRRLALPSYDHNSIVFVDVGVEGHASPPAVHVTGIVECTAERLDYPHGIEFLDDHTIVVRWTEWSSSSRKTNSRRADSPAHWSTRCDADSRSSGLPSMPTATTS
jgi:hypothetical protein